MQEPSQHTRNAAAVFCSITSVGLLMSVLLFGSGGYDFTTSEWLRVGGAMLLSIASVFLADWS